MADQIEQPSNTHDSARNVRNSKAARNIGKSALVGAALYGLGGLGATTSLTSCSKKTMDTVYHVTPPTTTLSGSTIEEGVEGIYYDSLNHMNAEQEDSSLKYEGIYSQPGQISAAVATSSGINFAGYASGLSIVHLSTSTQALEDQIDAIDASTGKGWLKDASGNRLLDPTAGNNPPPYMADLRTPEVYAAFKSYLVGLGTTYPGGLRFDSPDAAIATEDSYPAQCDGITERIAHLYRDVTETVALGTRQQTGWGYDASGNKYPIYQYPKEITVLSGIQDGNANQKALSNMFMDSVAHSGCGMERESAVWSASGVLDDAGNTEVIKQRFVQFAQDAYKYNRAYVSFTSEEPALANDSSGVPNSGYINAAKPVVAFWQDVTQRIEKACPGMDVRVKLIMKNATPYFNNAYPQDLIINRQLKYDPTMRAMGVTYNDAPAGHSYEIPAHSYEILNGRVERGQATGPAHEGFEHIMAEQQREEPRYMAVEGHESLKIGQAINKAKQGENTVMRLAERGKEKKSFAERAEARAAEAQNTKGASLA